jgi:nucleotide-binding universal stress UspA family protein
MAPQPDFHGPSSDARTGPRVIVGYDHHPSSAAALQVAMSMATAMNASLHIVHVVDLQDADPNIDDPDWEDRTQHALDAEQHAAEALLDSFNGRWTYETRRGQAAQVLARTATAEDALMIVIGERRAMHGAAVVHLLERSVLHHLLHLHPTTPVLVVPENAATRPATSAQPS